LRVPACSAVRLFQVGGKRYMPFLALRTETHMSKKQAKRRERIPSYRRHKASGQARVTLDGRDCYLSGVRNLLPL